MRLKWMWRWCPCNPCYRRRHPPPRYRSGIDMPKLLAMILEEGFDVRTDEFVERRNYSYGVFTP